MATNMHTIDLIRHYPATASLTFAMESTCGDSETHSPAVVFFIARHNQAEPAGEQSDQSLTPTGNAHEHPDQNESLTQSSSR
jgi:hypothetical protein